MYKYSLKNEGSIKLVNFRMMKKLKLFTGFELNIICKPGKKNNNNVYINGTTQMHC